PGHIDLVSRVAGPVVIGMIAGPEEKDRDSLAIKRSVVARTDAAGLLLNFEAVLLIDGVDQLIERLGRARALDEQAVLHRLGIASQPADHVHVDHRDSISKRKEWVLGVVVGAE